MTLNTHGHHIPGTTVDDEPKYHEVFLCDGISACPVCMDDRVSA